MTDTAKPLDQATEADMDISVRSVALTVVACAAAMYVLSWAREVFIPIVLSILISYALEPIVLGLMRIRLSRVIASGLLMAVLGSSIAYGGWALSDDAAEIVAALPTAAQKLRVVLTRGSGQPGTIEQVQQAADELQRTANAAAGNNPAPRGVQRVQIEQPAINVREYLSWGSASIITFGGQVTNFIPPRKGRRHALHVIREVLSMEAGGGTTDLAAALGYLGKVVKRRTAVFIRPSRFTTNPRGADHEEDA